MAERLAYARCKGCDTKFYPNIRYHSVTGDFSHFDELCGGCMDAVYKDLYGDIDGLPSDLVSPKSDHSDSLYDLDDYSYSEGSMPSLGLWEQSE